VSVDNILDETCERIIAIIDTALENTDPSPTETLCWCGEPTYHAAFGRVRGAWCREHSPRCRSGAHFFNNCLCVGEEELARRRAKGTL
jgi:hypothetical protein